MIYFDTLKVSTVEQAAEQTSARGGRSNPELIIWDYGKEITVSLEDALYTPASQSLMWGGRFGLGNFKIFGAWNPIIKNSITYEFETTNNEDAAVFRCSCDGELKTLTVVHSGYPDTYKYGNFQGEPYKYNNILVANSPHYYTQSSMKQEILDDGLSKPECGEIIIENFADFKVIPLIFEVPEDSEEDIGYFIEVTNEKIADVIEYQWIDCDIKLVSEEGEQDIYCKENVTICCRTTVNSNDYTFFIRDKEDNINFYIDFYKYQKFVMPNDFDNEEVSIKIPVGRFYIVQDRNFSNLTSEDLIYPIQHGLNNVYYLDRMEKNTAVQDFVINTDINNKMFQYSQLSKYSQTPLTVYINPQTMKPYEVSCDHYKKKNGITIYGNYSYIKKGSDYYRWTRSAAPDNLTLGSQIKVDAEHYPGTFRLVGETYARRRIDGKDERFQFEIPLCKLSSEANLTFEAAGDPATYNFKLKVLRGPNGTMMKLTQYEVDNIIKDNYCSSSTNIVPKDEIPILQQCCQFKGFISQEGTHFLLEIGHSTEHIERIEILNPIENTVYAFPRDLEEAFNGESPYLKFPENQTAAERYSQQEDKETMRNILLIKVTTSYKTEYITQQNYKDYNITFTVEEGDGQ